MSYVRGGEDEALHAKHHVKVIRGIPWDGLGKGKGKQTASDAGWKVVADHVEFGSGREKGKGRVLMCDGSWGGQKVSSRQRRYTYVQLAEILSTVDTVLSSPALDPPMLERCRIFLYVTSSPPPTPKKARPLPGAKQRANVERVVSVVVAQPIKVAMRVLGDGEQSSGCIDSGSGIMCEYVCLSNVVTRLTTVLSRFRHLWASIVCSPSRHTGILDWRNPCWMRLADTRSMAAHSTQHKAM